ncbi:hypothetical protein [Paracoccus albus]|uniref:hypothetical protein n=1 Tax=Paracoccus albus TaxID=3017784 RepID=UPI0022EFE6F8|nr:hypothetical protein [Paracoccus albus]WBU62107.1 hypothetical protein PAF20_16740 [Paracoccus albus]
MRGLVVLWPVKMVEIRSLGRGQITHLLPRLFQSKGRGLAKADKIRTGIQFDLPKQLEARCLKLGQILFAKAACNHLIRCAKRRRRRRNSPNTTLRLRPRLLHPAADEKSIVIVVVVLSAAAAIIIVIITSAAIVIIGKSDCNLPH